MSKKRSTNQKKRSNRESDASIRSIDKSDAACIYLYGSRMLVIGKSDKMKKAIENLKMPALPRLMSNRAEREALQMSRWKRFKAATSKRSKHAYVTFKSAFDLCVGTIKGVVVKDDVKSPPGVWCRTSRIEQFELGSPLA